MDTAITIVAFLIAIISVGAQLVDRSARADAWRRIAEERRWDYERRTSSM